MNTIYKGIEIIKVHETCYIFYFQGTKYRNTNLHFAKRMISRELKNAK
jgi:hypothetical protein